jgi:hypothetical protein
MVETLQQHQPFNCLTLPTIISSVCDKKVHFCSSLQLLHLTFLSFPHFALPYQSTIDASQLALRCSEMTAQVISKKFFHYRT